MREITYEPVKGGIHAGGQHSQKNATGVRATHHKTGIVVVIRGRIRQESIRKARKAIKEEIARRKSVYRQEKLNADRLEKIANMRIIRTYHFPRGMVKDHRTGAVASLKDVLRKGRIDLLKGG